MPLCAEQLGWPLLFCHYFRLPRYLPVLRRHVLPAFPSWAHLFLCSALVTRFTIPVPRRPYNMNSLRDKNSVVSAAAMGVRPLKLVSLLYVLFLHA